MTITQQEIRRIKNLPIFVGVSPQVQNQIFVLGCNRTGTDRNSTFGGNSMIVDPMGDVVAQADDAETLLVADIQLDSVAASRQWLSLLDDRRPQAYETVNERSP